MQKEIEEIENFDADMEELEKALSEADEAMQARARILTEERERGANELSASIERELHALGMPAAKFRIEVSPLESCSPNGADAVCMMFSANAGEDEKELAKVASGGELSRIALALKAMTAEREDCAPSMVFDEIDTGLGGRTAQMVAERIAMVARWRQVLCITHLPQIACMADIHLYIAKQSEGEKTATHVLKLSDAERVSEIARMASGADATAASLDNAREMVLHAKLVKGKLGGPANGE